jgi:hypothetical protein
MAWTINVATPDLAAFINRLEKFDGDVSKELKQRLRKASGLVAKNARSRQEVPLSNWGRYRWIEQDRAEGRNLRYQIALARKKIKVETYRGRSSGVTTAFGMKVVQRDAAGAIFELAGSQNRSGHRFNSSLNRVLGNGPFPRSLFPAYYAVMPQTQADIEKAIRNAERRVGL